MSASYSTTLLTNATATGGWVQWSGGRGVAYITGTFAGASATLEYQALGGSGVPVAAMSDTGVQTTVALTANGSIGFELPPGLIRAALSGGAPTGMNAIAARIVF